ncbi:7TM-DISM domain-containing protein [Halopseudomonas pachastrellae]|nr:7TM-DISM domain-containing protein [Halopseudomonas pachastrellae]
MFVLLLFSGATLAEPRIALQSPVVNLTSFQVGYYIDDSQTLGFDDVRQQSFKETSSTTTLGTNARVTWFRIPLDNQTDQGWRSMSTCPMPITYAQSRFTRSVTANWCTATSWTWRTWTPAA